MKPLNFTKEDIKKLEPPKKGRDYYRDTKEKGLSLYITSNGVVTFFIRKSLEGKDQKITIGNFPEITISQARQKAMQIKSQIANGEDPTEEKTKIKDDLTFGEIFWAIA